MTGGGDSRAVGTRAMILAAGLGLRMRPLTLTTPKPLVPVGGKRLIDYAFDRLKAGGVTEAVVNVHHHADQIEAWAAGRTAPRITVSDERGALLDTGGGISKALPRLGTHPFFVLNSDSFWLDGVRPALDRLREAWNDGRMESLLLMAPVSAAVGYDGKGDFHMDSDGRLTRRSPAELAPFVYAGCFLVSPRLFFGAPPGAFSMNLLWDRAAAAGRLYGLRHDGLWIHVGTPESIAYAERAMKEGHRQ